MATILKPYGSSNWEKEALKNIANVIGVVDVTGVSTGALTEDEIAEVIKSVDIFVADVDITVTRQILGQGEKLKAVLCKSIGVDYVDINAATEYGILVANNPDFCVTAVAEYTMALLLSIARKIIPASLAVKRDEWGARTTMGGIELFGKTLGIIGLGRIGREVAAKAKAFGMEIIAYSPNAGPAVASTIGARTVSLEELLQNSDVISIHTSLREETNKLINAEKLKLVKKGAYLVNVARAGIVDEQALADALNSGRLAGAALDVLTLEPPEKENPLLNTDNILITPHIGWFTAEAFEKANRTLVEQVKSVLAGVEPPHVVNPEVIDRWKKRLSNF
ncbi:MAG: hydroxyacid dehydrogenase [Firmicutes bacterium]|nr:hydroxyacid dehydrogenase [Bacillota bacterium]